MVHNLIRVEGCCTAYLFISVGTTEWHASFLVTILFHRAPSKAILVLMLFVIFRGLVYLIGVKVGMHGISLAFQWSFVYFFLFTPLCSQSMVRGS